MLHISHLYIIHNTKVKGCALLHASDPSYPPLYLDISLQK